MTIHIKAVRKDGKLQTIFAYDNGARLTKVLTVQEFEEANAKADNPYPIPLTSKEICLRST